MRNATRGPKAICVGNGRRVFRVTLAAQEFPEKRVPLPVILQKTIVLKLRPSKKLYRVPVSVCSIWSSSFSKIRSIHIYKYAYTYVYTHLHSHMYRHTNPIEDTLKKSATPTAYVAQAFLSEAYGTAISVAWRRSMGWLREFRLRGFRGFKGIFRA